MFRYHISAAIRQITQFKNHTAFSLTGLVIGLACVFIISAWSIQELRYDRFHHRSGDIFMVTTDIKDHTGNVTRFPETPAPLAAELVSQVPRIEDAFHFLYLYGGRTLKKEGHTFEESGIAATSEFLEVLNFKLLSGDAGELDDPNSIFLSRELANKIFPGEEPVNQELLYKENRVLVVKGVFKNVPVNSSLVFDFLIPYEIEYGISNEWWQLSDATFIRTAPSADIGEVHSLMRKIWRERITDKQYDIGLIVITDLRYGADFEFFNAEHGHGDRNKLFMFMGIALMILILACLNYLNLISAHTIKKEREVWIRKVQGASAGDISTYYVIESVIISLIAWGLAALLSALGIRVYENLIGIKISPYYLYRCIGIGLPASILLVGLASGFFPAVRAGSRALVQLRESGRPVFFVQRRLMAAFVVSQFGLSIGLVISSLVIFRQADYMKNFDTGYATENIVEFKLPDAGDSLLHEIKSALTAMPDVACFSFGSSSPVSLTFLNTMENWEWEGLEEGEYSSIYSISIDEEYLNVFRIPLIMGRIFSPSGKEQGKILINEKLAGIMGQDDPVGQRIRRGDEEYEITGVVRNFNFQHLSGDVGPFLFMYRESNRNLFVRFHSSSNSGMDGIRAMLSSLYDHPVDYRFIDKARDNLYHGEMQILTAVLIFAFLCIAISVLGLAGIVSHSTAARTKEIAVRKVLGADSRDVMIFLNMDLLKMFLPGMLLGSFIAWFIMGKWLENYSHRIGIEGWVFILGPGIILIVALLSVGFQIWKASRQSPAMTLKYQ